MRGEGRGAREQPETFAVDRLARSSPPVLPSSLSIVVPTLNEAEGVAEFLQTLQPLRERGVEVIVADGGSLDATVSLATPLVDRLISCPRGRALQMNAGAAIARGNVLLFLHADCSLPADADLLIAIALLGSDHHWGRFDVRLSGAARLLRTVETMMNWRSRITGICTGDQGIFVERPLFESIGAFPPLPLMEDIAISRALKRHSAPLCLSAKITASSRRWEKQGIWRTIMLMWRLRLAYFLGARPGRLAEIYHGRTK